jgi:hypothetical protein
MFGNLSWEFRDLLVVISGKRDGDRSSEAAIARMGPPRSTRRCDLDETPAGRVAAWDSRMVVDSPDRWLEFGETGTTHHRPDRGERGLVWKRRIGGLIAREPGLEPSGNTGGG